MPTHLTPTTAHKMQHLFAMLQSGHIKQVVQELQSLLLQVPNNKDVFHLAALAYKADKQVELAVTFFKQSLMLDNKQPQVHNNLGNLYKQLGQLELAEKHYQQAVVLDKKFVSAWKNLGILLLNAKEFERAIKAFNSVLRLNSNDVSALTSMGNIYKAQEKFPLAIDYYQKALKIDPNYINALNNLGMTYRLLEHLDSALVCFQKAKAASPNMAEIDFNEANTLFDKGDYARAEKSYWSALNKAPDNIEVHDTLNEFYWQTGKKNEFGKSYKLAIDHLPHNIVLRKGYIESLMSAGNISEASVILEKSLTIDKTPSLMYLKGKISVLQNKLTDGIQAFESSLSMHYDLAVALDFIELLIFDFQYEKALQYINQAELVAPFNQLLIAYKSTCWRLMNDERYEWLIDYQNHIKGYDIPVPQGYSSREAFLSELEQVLVPMHTTQHEPLKQTLKHGTQTPGRLFNKPIPQIQALKHSFELVVKDYIDSLQTDSTHPLLSRKTTKFSFAGSWSVKLKPNGFHVNHVHPLGWLSSSFYIKVPDFSLHSQSSHNAGSIKFGESSMGLGDREVISRIIAPTAGKVVIFPSYAWHGTIGFNGGPDDSRLTAPCDIIPQGK
ncbi:2OG-Fe(II) oxygenase family protein [Colwelliaceae bacterium 6471]